MPAIPICQIGSGDSRKVTKGRSTKISKGEGQLLLSLRFENPSYYICFVFCSVVACFLQRMLMNNVQCPPYFRQNSGKLILQSPIVHKCVFLARGWSLDVYGHCVYSRFKEIIINSLSANYALTTILLSVCLCVRNVNKQSLCSLPPQLYWKPVCGRFV